MSRERWFRTQDEQSAFDWSRSARELDVPLEVARALYVRVMQLTADVERAETLYRRWLREAAAARAAQAAAAVPVPVPGRASRVSRETDGSGLRRLWGGDQRVPGKSTQLTDEQGSATGARPAWQADRLAPGKTTRVLYETSREEAFEASAASMPGAGDVEAAMRSLRSGSSAQRLDPAHGRSLLDSQMTAAPKGEGANTGHATRLDGQPVAPGSRSPEAADGDLARDPLAAADAESQGAEAAQAGSLREQLFAAAEQGRSAAELLAAAAPAEAAAVLRELRNQPVPGRAWSALRLVTQAAGGEVERVLGRGGVGAAVPAEIAARLAPHVGAQAAGAARLHTDDAADLVAAAHHARALTVGADIYFARGEYAPGSARGDELLTHELTHVAQGQRGELARAAAKGVDSGGPLDPAEAEADLRARMAVLQLHP